MTGGQGVMGESLSKNQEKENRKIAEKTGFGVVQVREWRELFMV